MISNRPYLLRALNEWILDNGLTPYILVDAEVEGVVVPGQFIQEGKIVLNISPNAVRDLAINNDYLFFNARFSGNAVSIEVPINAVIAIYAKENNQGMMFPEEEMTEQDLPSEEIPVDPKPHLKIVK